MDVEWKCPSSAFLEVSQGPGSPARRAKLRGGRSKSVNAHMARGPDHRGAVYGSRVVQATWEPPPVAKWFSASNPDRESAPKARMCSGFLLIRCPQPVRKRPAIRASIIATQSRPEALFPAFIAALSHLSTSRPRAWHGRCPCLGSGVRIRSRFREVQGTAPNGQRQGSRLRILAPEPGTRSGAGRFVIRDVQRVGQRAVTSAVSLRVHVVRSSRRSRKPASLSSSRSPRANLSQS